MDEDDRPIEQTGVLEIFVDGWGCRTINDGIYSSVGFRVIDGQRVGVIRIIQRESGVRKATTDSQAALERKANHSITIFDRPKVVN